MLLTSPLARTVLLLVLAALVAALMVARVTVSDREGQGAVAPESRVVSLSGHSPGSEAHARHEYRLRVVAAAAAAG
jgi:hypothetical protein